MGDAAGPAGLQCIPCGAAPLPGRLQSVPCVRLSFLPVCPTCRRQRGGRRLARSPSAQTKAATAGIRLQDWITPGPPVIPTLQIQLVLGPVFTLEKFALKKITNPPPRPEPLRASRFIFASRPTAGFGAARGWGLGVFEWGEPLLGYPKWLIGKVGQSIFRLSLSLRLRRVQASRGRYSLGEKLFLCLRVS